MWSACTYLVECFFLFLFGLMWSVISNCGWRVKWSIKRECHQVAFIQNCHRSEHEVGHSCVENGFSATKLFSAGESCVMDWWWYADGQHTHPFIFLCVILTESKVERERETGKTMALVNKSLQKWEGEVTSRPVKHLCWRRRKKLQVGSSSSCHLGGKRNKSSTGTISICFVYGCYHLHIRMLVCEKASQRDYNYSAVSSSS